MALLDIVNINYCLILFSGLLFANRRRNNGFLLGLIATQLVLLLGLRGETVGIDTQTCFISAEGYKRRFIGYEWA